MLIALVASALAWVIDSRQAFCAPFAARSNLARLSSRCLAAASDLEAEPFRLSPLRFTLIPARVDAIPASSSLFSFDSGGGDVEVS